MYTHVIHNTIIVGTTVLTLTFIDTFFCLYHVMLCARSNDVTASIFACK